ncbi:MAG: LLM class flavin-dependent oxidoreductase [Halobacteriales archaeon]|nr:LLM class flavin-dependent oxidoreductase [Halobacteriales archaeon]|tara:strand:+ start:82 stop:1104 length:1023 start_codon:yes stop_codon:yes gene_type:complete
MKNKYPRVSVNYPASTTFDEFRTTVNSIENLHYDGLTVADQSLRRNTYSWSAFAAHNTNRIWVGPAVTNPFSRNPGLTAASIATIDEISNGRAVLGIGLGGHGVGPFGYDQTRSIGACKDSIIAIRSLLSGEKTTMIRDEFELHDASLEFNTPSSSIPIYVGGRGPLLLSLAGKFADGVFIGGGLLSSEGMEYARDRISIGAKSVNRDITNLDLRCFASLSIASDADVALDGVTRHIATRVSNQANLEALQRGGASQKEIDHVVNLDLDSLTTKELRDEVPFSIIEQFVLCGTPEYCSERFHSFFESGITNFTIVARTNSENGRFKSLKLFSDMVLSSYF